MSGAAALARLIRDHQPCVVLTGAGISTESGIPDFRSATGMWADFDPREYATLGAFRRDPEKVWRFYAPRFSMLADAEPNAAHLALAELERMGFLRAVVTQNIDLLHGRAGSGDVVEVHGSIRESHCPRCDARYELPRVFSLLEAGDGAPRCPACGGVLKPGVVFFDELLPEEAIDRAFALAREARLLLVVGSSLEVYPVAGLPQETLDAGGAVAVVSRGPTWVDGRAALTLDASAGDVLAEVVAQLTPTREPVVVADHDPSWATAAEEEAGRVRAALGERVVAVEHIGSTSVPGLPAKPILDLAAGLRDLDVTPEEIRAMAVLGYEYLGEFGLPGRLYFRKGETRRTHHVHAVVHGSDSWREYLAFRNYLRCHPQEAQAYAEAKRRLAEDVGGRWDAYVERKEEFAQPLAERARAWADGRVGRGYAGR